MVLNPPTFLQNRDDHTARGDRLWMKSLARTAGKVSNTDLLVTQNLTPDMGVRVSPGAVFVEGTNQARQGMYHCFNDAFESVPVDAAHGTLVRNDVLVAEVLDSFYTGAEDKWQLRVVPGTPGSGTEPALPANSVRLASITVPAGASSITNANITTRHQLSNSVGTPINVANTTALNALQAADGTLAFVDNEDKLYYFDGGGWEPLYRGAVHYSASDSGFPKSVGTVATPQVIDRITIPAAPFKRILLIHASTHIWYSQAGRIDVLLYVNNVSRCQNRQYLPASTSATTGTSYVLNGQGELAANTAGVVEMRVSRVDGSGIATNSLSTLNRLLVTAVPAE